MKPVECRHCGARSDMDPIEAFRRIAACNNCQMDIKLKGVWTGRGAAIRRVLLHRWGKAHVEAAEDLARVEKTLAKGAKS